ncbi:hypothetical protein KR222_007445 [Zaprionus bogoriensis]|nr:hypothetical protein KR222_007445 [Zaprionus bogoriensis]
MEHASHGRLLLVAALLLTLLLLQQEHADTASTTNTDPKADTRNSVKKEKPPTPQELAPVTVEVTPKPANQGPVPAPVANAEEKKQQESAPKHNFPEDGHKAQGDDFPETYVAVFYVLVGITSMAILLLIVRVYRLRLSRAERKYGVQGDRANQELTPLPMAIEDVNSDEDDEDHTLFEVNRQSIRIL